MVFCDMWQRNESQTRSVGPNDTEPITRRKKSSVRKLSIETFPAHEKKRLSDNFSAIAEIRLLRLMSTYCLHLLPCASAQSITVMRTFSCPSVGNLTSLAPLVSMHLFADTLEPDGRFATIKDVSSFVFHFFAQLSYKHDKADNFFNRVRRRTLAGCRSGTQSQIWRVYVTPVRS